MTKAGAARRRRTRRDPSTPEVADLRYVPKEIEPFEVKSAVTRALALTDRPLRYVGIGMTSLVFCDDRGAAYKVARRPGKSDVLQDEAEFLATANQVPGLRDRVAKLYAYDWDLDVIVRSCPEPVEDSYKRRGKLHQLWREIADRISPYGWGPPEFKEDAFVITRSGPVLVDAGFARRQGRRMLAYVQDILRGKREKPERDRWSDLAFYLRQEASAGALSARQVNPTIRRLGEHDPGALEWLVG